MLGGFRAGLNYRGVIPLGTANLDGLISAARVAKLDSLRTGATAATADTTALRDAGGDLFARYLNSSQGERNTVQPHVVIGKNATDNYHRGYDPGSLTAGGALALTRGFADGNKLDGIAAGATRNPTYDGTATIGSGATASYGHGLGVVPAGIVARRTDNSGVVRMGEPADGQIGVNGVDSANITVWNRTAGALTVQVRAIG